MPNINHILFPIDFSERCCHIVLFVESMARRFGAKITLFSVAEAVYYALGDPGGPIIINAELVLDDLQARLDTPLRSDFEGIPVTRVAKLGDPAHLIADYAKMNGVDLIMMPTHGYGIFRRLLLGSVTAKVLHDVACPVWTAVHTPEPPSPGRSDCRSVLCAVDGGPQTVQLIRWASEFASNANAILRFVNVIPTMQDLSSRRMDRESTNATLHIANLQEAAGCDAPLSVLAGNVIDCVCDEASRRLADVLIIGRGAIQEGFGRLRAHAYGIIRQSPCPVLSV